MTEDPTALYAALATVAAITSALQGSAALSASTRVASLETAFDQTRPSTNERQRASAEARQSRPGILVVNACSAIISSAVVAAWGEVTFCRSDNDWVLIVPWIAIAATVLALAYIGLFDSWSRLKAVANGSRGSTNAA